MRQRRETEFRLAPRSLCYSFESCFHGRRFISLHRWPSLPLHGGHVSFEQFNARWPLPHVAGSPNLGVLSASMTAAGSLDPSRFWLGGPYKLALEPGGSPLFTWNHSIACWRYEPRKHPKELAITRLAILPSPLRDKVGYFNYDRFRG